MRMTMMKEQKKDTNLDSVLIDRLNKVEDLVSALQQTLNER
jgi:hypothetical protein